MWFPKEPEERYSETKVYAITDRPVYQPKQTVHYKFWVRHAQYDMPDTSELAHRDFKIKVSNPKNETIFSAMKKTDAYGGIEGEYAIAADAALGHYCVSLAEPKPRKNGPWGYASFDVEEYKKPEFEVTVEAPSGPIVLGGKIAATIRAKYYFGSPITRAKVKYTIIRNGYDGRWYPAMPWDWFYGPGYWWFASDDSWYPGWSQWGCPPPTAGWRY